ncbi:MAG: Na+:solute symporter [Deltaproteobacteria bacterium]|nr:Na+:solute symporter [Deltaproteobacteria bacterium]
MATFPLHRWDLVIIGVYLALALAVGLKVQGQAGTDRVSYFLAGRGLPWWWAGLSIAATTFAADTPLAITGIVAERGASGNWLWWSWIGVHAAVAVYFAGRWSRSGVLTDAELLSLRYSGRLAEGLRVFRAGLYGVVINALTLGWVLRAMVKIVSPFFDWQAWTPGLVGAVGAVLPAGFLGSPGEALTILSLLALVAIYSTAGGLRGVVLTDLIQLGAALFGAGWLAWSAWGAAGGRTGILSGLAEHYGPDHHVLDFFPDLSGGWPSTLGLGAAMFGLYLVVQAYANLPADGGGYFMQRLNATRGPRDARRAAVVFMVVQYVLRTLPWLVVAVAALVLLPVGHEASALGGAGAAVADDRELAYPVLMGALLPAGGLGLVLTSLLAAFMSTVDTHLNWGASYVVNDLYLRRYPDASDAEQVRVARWSVVAFTGLAVLVSAQIDSIADAWTWLGLLGAAIGIPTLLRWLWWRVSAASELGALVVGLGCAAALALTDLGYELRLVLTAAASVLGLAAGTVFGPETERATLDAFLAQVAPVGVWPGQTGAARRAMQVGLRFILVAGGVVALMAAAQGAAFTGLGAEVVAVGLAGAAALYAGGRGGADEA